MSEKTYDIDFFIENLNNGYEKISELSADVNDNIHQAVKSLKIDFYKLSRDEKSLDQDSRVVSRTFKNIIEGTKDKSIENELTELQYAVENIINDYISYLSKLDEAWSALSMIKSLSSTNIEINLKGVVEELINSVKEFKQYDIYTECKLLENFRILTEKIVNPK